jgi:tetrahydromethanopterin S-methyltransferase subunit G
MMSPVKGIKGTRIGEEVTGGDIGAEEGAVVGVILGGEVTGGDIGAEEGAVVGVVLGEEVTGGEVGLDWIMLKTICPSNTLVIFI